MVIFTVRWADKIKQKFLRVLLKVTQYMYLSYLANQSCLKESLELVPQKPENIVSRLPSYVK
jgi:hypothetical protein